MKEYWTALASLMGAFAFLQGVLHTVFPAELRAAVSRLLGRATRAFSPYCYFDVMEMDGMSTNEIYDAVQLYLSSAAAPAVGARLSLSRPLNASSFTFGLAASDRVVDSFRGASVTWEHVVAPRQGQGFSWRPLPEEKRRFTLRIRRGDREKLLPAYLDHILGAAQDIRRRSQDRLLYTNARGGGGMDARGMPWDPVPFKHPSTFATLAMDPARKAAVMADLRDFADGRAFYERTGRAWKRGYLLYGPPGTGKSSMIAAMANFLGYDVYDLELTEVSSNAELRKLLMKTTSKSIIVIEDIDCSVDLTNRAAAPPPPPLPNKPPAVGGDQDAGSSSRSITLSGLLNFTDGLWSCCGAERIFVFTTNHVEKLDPALLRSGRMDMHIFMSYCTFPALKILLRNYLAFQDDGELERLAGSDVVRGLEEWIDAAEITPADVSEVLIKNRRNGKEEAVRELLDVFKARAQKRTGAAGAASKGGAAGADNEEEEEEKRTLESPDKEGTADTCAVHDDEAKKQA